MAGKNRKLADHLKALLKNCEAQLALIESEEASEAIIAAGRALETIQAQVASIVEARRIWMTLQETTRKKQVRLAPADLVWLRYMGESYECSDISIPHPQAALANEFGCSLAIVDDDRPNTGPSGGRSFTDTIWLRRPRPVTIAVYLKHEDASTGKQTWRLEADTVRHLDVVDALSAENSLCLDNKGLELAFHPDMSVKTYGVKTVATAESVATSIGGVLEAATKAREKPAVKPAPAAPDPVIVLVAAGASNGRHLEAISVIRSRPAASA